MKNIEKELEVSKISHDTYICFASTLFKEKNLSDVDIRSQLGDAYEMRHNGLVVGIVKVSRIKEPFTLMQGLICKSGYGKHMIDWVHQRNKNQSTLITVTGSNRKLISYYKKQGFRKLTTEDENILMLKDERR